MLADVGLYPLEAGALRSTGESGHGIHQTAGEIFGAHIADGAVAFEGQTEGIELRVAGRANRIGAVRTSFSRIGRSHLASSLGSSGTTGGGGGITSPSTRFTTQLPRFTGLVRSPGEFSVRKTAMGRSPPRP